MKKLIFLSILIVIAVAACDEPGLPENPMEIIVYPVPATESMTVVVKHQGSPFELKAFNPKGDKILDVKAPPLVPTSDYYSTGVWSEILGTYYFVLNMNGKEYRKTSIYASK